MNIEPVINVDPHASVRNVRIMNTFICNNCFSALKAVDIDSDDAEEFKHIFEDGVAAASNPVSNFSDAAVISMESNTVEVEDANAMIVADLQECIGSDSKRSATRVNLARGLQANKKSSKKTTKVSLKGVKKSNKDSIVPALSNSNSEQQVTLVSTVGAVSSSISTAPTISLNVLERYLHSSTSLVMSPPSDSVIRILPNSTTSLNNSVSSVSHSTFGQSTASSNSSMSEVVERANQGTKRSVSEHGKEDVAIKTLESLSTPREHSITKVLF